MLSLRILLAPLLIVAALLNPVYPVVHAQKVTRLPTGQTEVTGTVGDMDFSAVVDKMTEGGRVKKIEITTGAKGGYKVVTEYDNAGAWMAVRRWLDQFRRQHRP